MLALRDALAAAGLTASRSELADAAAALLALAGEPAPERGLDDLLRRLPQDRANKAQVMPSTVA